MGQSPNKAEKSIAYEPIGKTDKHDYHMTTSLDRIVVTNINNRKERNYTKVSKQNFENSQWEKVRNKQNKYIIEILKGEYGNHNGDFMRIKEINGNINDSWTYYKLKKTAK